MKINWQAATNVIIKIEQAGFEAVFVGGAVRDRLLGKTANDVDIATSALPTEVKRIFQKTVDVGIEHGTILVLDEGEPIEVTTYRTEGDYVDFRRPGEVHFVRSLEEDLKRRDFTMNALAMKHTGEIIDLYDGKGDIECGIIRAVGNPTERFKEDALRMLRAARFSAQLGFTIEEKTFTAIEDVAHLIEHIAVERICQELEKIWLSESPARGLKTLVSSGLSNHLPVDFAPYLQKWSSFKANDVKDGWAFLVLTTNDEAVIKRFKLSNKEKNYALQIRRTFTHLQQATMPLLALFDTDEAYILTASKFATWLNVNVLDAASLIEQKRSFVIQTRSELAATGNDLMAWTARRGGPWVKEALDQLLVAVLEGQVENNEQQLKDWFMRYDNN